MPWSASFSAGCVGLTLVPIRSKVRFPTIRADQANQEQERAEGKPDRSRNRRQETQRHEPVEQNPNRQDDKQEQRRKDENAWNIPFVWHVYPSGHIPVTAKQQLVTRLSQPPASAGWAGESEYALMSAGKSDRTFSERGALSMRQGVIHLVNPKTDSLTTRPLYLNRALYSPIAGLLAVAAAIPRERYEVVLTDENIEEVDFDLKCDLVGISAMTAYVNRGYEIADEFRRRGVKVIMGGVHPSFMSKEALTHCDAVCIGEAELILPKILADLEDGSLGGTYRSDKLHPMVGIPMPRYDLVKRHRYVNKTFVQTSRGCHQGCTFCAEPLMNGLKFRYRPIDEVMYEVDNCGSRMISINDADFFGTPDRPKEVMRALKGRKVRWQAGVTSKLAQDDRMLELAAESGCTMLSIGFESISRDTLKSVHKHVNRPEQFAELVEKVHSYGIAVFGLFMFGFDGDDTDTFQETARFNIEANYDAVAYSVLTPYPGTLTWYEMKKANRIVSFDWEKYDQANVVYRPAKMTGEDLRLGHIGAYKTFYSASSIARRFPWKGGRNVVEWSIYNMFMKKGSATDRKDKIADATPEPELAPIPPLLPVKREWRDAVLEAIGVSEESYSTAHRSAPVRDPVVPIHLPATAAAPGHAQVP